MKTVSTLAATLLCVAAYGCRTEPWSPERYEKPIQRAISKGQYEKADRLITAQEAGSGGGLFYDARLFRWAMVKVKAGHTSEATNLIEQLLFEMPDSPYRDRALQLREQLKTRE